MNKINMKIRLIETQVGTAMLIAIVVMVFLSAILRLVNIPLVWCVDLAQLLFIWISMIGADLALKNKAHMGVDLLVRRFPISIQRLLKIFTFTLCIIFLLFIAYWGATLVKMNWKRKYQMLAISYSWATMAIPVMSTSMILVIFEQFYESIGLWKSDKEAV